MDGGGPLETVHERLADGSVKAPTIEAQKVARLSFSSGHHSLVLGRENAALMSVIFSLSEGRSSVMTTSFCSRRNPPQKKCYPTTPQGLVVTTESEPDRQMRIPDASALGGPRETPRSYSAITANGRVQHPQSQTLSSVDDIQPPLTPPYRRTSLDPARFTLVRNKNQRGRGRGRERGGSAAPEDVSPPHAGPPRRSGGRGGRRSIQSSAAERRRWITTARASSPLNSSRVLWTSARMS